jgi:Tfp pilus assembly protein PilP
MGKQSITGAFDLTINLGDAVTYPGRRGSYIWLNRGIVVHIDDNCEYIVVSKRRWEKRSKDVKVYNLHYVVPLPDSAESAS